MKIHILQPYCISAPESVCLPAPEQADTDDRLFIVSSDQALAASLVEALNQRLQRRRKITPEEFNDMLDEAMTALGQRARIPDLAFMLIQSAGILMAQMGRSRTLHLDAAEQEVAYDSRDQIMDFNAKARSELITRVKPGDCLLITLTDRVDSRALARVIGRGDDTETTQHNITKTLAANRDQAPATIMISIADKGANPFAALPDMNWKWGIALIALLALIAGVALLSLSDFKLPRINTDNKETPTTDTTRTDTLAPPAAAVEIPTEPEPVVESEPKPKAEPEKTETKPATKPEPTAPAPEPVTTPEPAPATAQPTTPEPVTSPEHPATTPAI